MNWSELFTYEPHTGRLLWAVKRPGGKAKEIGDEAGSVRSDGRYRSVVVAGKRYYVHRIVWQMVRGAIPAGMCIDHIDGCGLNNRLANLRLVTLSENQRNRKVSKNSTTGALGVYRRRYGFEVRCGSEYIGHFSDLPSAEAARRVAQADRGFLERTSE